ncbi:MAG: cache domain-containing protein, partial [Spirochaetaceae bacterium]|nr:cache domain-containing protein [Spirochaetaceae bacterium]
MRRVVYSNYLLPYLLILFPPILLSIAFYFSSFRLVEGLERSSVAISLSNTGGLIESRMDDLRQIVTTLSFDPDLLAAASRNEPVTRSSFYSLIEAHNNLPPYQLTNDLVHSYYLYFRGSDIIMSSETVSFRLPVFYESSLRYEDLTFADWKSFFLEGLHSNEMVPPMNVFSGAASESLLTYVNSFPSTYFGHSLGTTILLLRKERLDRFLSQIAVQDGSWAVLVNSDWQTLADAGPVLPELIVKDLWSSIEHANVEAGSIDFNAEDQ